jgi:hypothetical protein
VTLTARSCRIDLDETIWKAGGSGLDKSDLMREHLFDELRYVVQARFSDQREASRPNVYDGEDRRRARNRVLPALGRG